MNIETLERRIFLSTVVVNTAIDGTFGEESGIVSLRDAIGMANGSPTSTTIMFDPTVFADAQTITMIGQQLELSNVAAPVTITGPAARVTINGNNASRVLEIDAGVTANLSGITITNGNTVIGAEPDAHCGAGIFNNGTLHLDRAAVTGCTAKNSGGGIYNSQTGHMTLTAVTLSGNTSNVAGGGIFNDFAATLTNVTIANNRAPKGGGFWSSSRRGTSSVLTNVTVAGNMASGNGGGIFNDGAKNQVTLANSIIAGNAAGRMAAGPDAFGAMRSLGHNLIGKTDGSHGLRHGDRTGTIKRPLDDKLSPLGNYGGPTQTMPPLPGSPAIDHGSNSLIPGGTTEDQRGFARIVNRVVDIGAVEVQAAVVMFGRLPIVPAEEGAAWRSIRSW